MENTYWALTLVNFEGENEVVYFASYEIALTNFQTICEKYKNYNEFCSNNNSCEWFDPSYNEYSTYVRLSEEELPKIYNEIIF